jgi:mannitol/fructose-specific phosphotransferase system IIA component (Ntr-type)
MSHKNMNISELASMLGADFHHLTHMARRGDLPCQTVRGELRFNALHICSWLKQRIPAMGHPELIQIDAGMSLHRGEPFMPSMVAPLLEIPAITADLDARTPSSLKRKLVNLANDTQRVYDSQALLDDLMCSTLPSGVGLLHPTQALPYALAEPVIVVAKTRGQVMFNQYARTDLFFLCAAQDESHHLHILARLCRLLQDQDLIDQLKQAETPLDIKEAITEAEDTLVACAV